MTLIQTKLVSLDDGGYMITWLPKDNRVKAGAVISLHKSEEKWRVLEQWSKMDHSDINRKWDVGGLV